MNTKNPHERRIDVIRVRKKNAHSVYLSTTFVTKFIQNVKTTFASDVFFHS